MINNQHKVLEGSIESIQFWAEVLVAELDATPKEANNNSSAMRIDKFSIPIMGNPRHPQTVTMKVKLDERVGKGEIKIEAGYELLQWQAKTESLCLCCTHGKRVSKVILCAELMAYAGKKIRSCKKYKHRNKDTG